MTEIEILKKQIRLITIILTTLFPLFRKYLSKDSLEIIDKAISELGKIKNG